MLMPSGARPDTSRHNEEGSSASPLQYQYKYRRQKGPVMNIFILESANMPPLFDKGPVFLREPPILYYWPQRWESGDPIVG